MPESPALPFGFNSVRPPRSMPAPTRGDPLVEIVRGLRADAVKQRKLAALAPSAVALAKAQGVAVGLDEAADRIERAMERADQNGG